MRSLAGWLRCRSVSSMRRMNWPRWRRARARLKRATYAVPTWGSPVGLGAMRVRVVGMGAEICDRSSVAGLEEKRHISTCHGGSGGLHSTSTPKETDKKMTTLRVNGKPRDVDVPANTPLLWVLRDELQL